MRAYIMRTKAKTLKRNKDIAARIFGFIIVLLGTICLAIQMPKVQTGLAERVLHKLEKKIDADIQFSDISIKPFNAVSLSDVVIIDKNPYTEDINNTGYAPADTFFCAEKVTASISFKSLLKRNGIYINRAFVKNGMMHYVNEPREEYGSNMKRIFGMKKKDKPKTRGTANIFEVGKVNVENFNFKMTNFKSTKPYTKESGINWADMDVTANIIGHNLKYTGGRMSGILDHCDLYEKSGYSAQRLSGRCIVGMGKTTIEKLHLKDPWSDINIPVFEMNYDDTKSFKNFMEEVRMKLKVSNGTLSTKTIDYICGALHGKDLTLDLKNTDVRGYVNDLDIKKLHFSEKDSGVSGDINGRITGLPKTNNLLIDAEVGSLDFTTAGLSKLINKVSPGSKVNLGKYLPGQKLSFSGEAEGYINDLKANGKLKTPEGRLSADVAIRNLANKAHPTTISGTLGTNNIDVGSISGVESLGDASLKTRFSAVLDGKNTSVNIDSVNIDKFKFNGYEYKNIKCQGQYTDGGFDGHIECNDPNLKMSFDGMATLPSKKNEDKTAVYDFAADIDYADLKALGLDKRDGSSKVSASLNANITTAGKDDLTGQVDIYNLVLENDHGRKEIGDAKLRSVTTDGQQSIIFNSDFADASYQGNRKFTDLLADIQTVTTRRELPALYSKDSPDKGHDDAFYSLILNTHDTRDVLSYALPGLYIADSTRVELRMDEGNLNGSMSSSRIAWKTNYVKDAELTLDNQQGSLNAILTSDEMSFKNIGFQNSAFTAFAQDNNYFAGFHYDGIEGINNFGEIYLSGQIERDAVDTLVVTANPLSSYLNFNGSQWDIDESEIIYRNKAAKFNGVNMHNEEQSITINGGIAANDVDTLRLDINNVDISVINYFTSKDYDFKGRTTGMALLSSPMKGEEMRALLSLDCDSLHVSGQDAGSLKAVGVWDKATDKVYAFVNNIIDGRDAINAKGSYNTDSKYIDLSASLDEMNPVLATPFISSILSDMSGGISGQVLAKGTPDSLTVSSEGTRFNNSKFRINYTNVLYTLDGPFHVDNSGLWFDSVNVYDTEDGRGVITGGVALKQGGGIELASQMRLNDLMVINTGYGQNFYGKLYARGNAYVSGPTNAILVEADVITSKDGKLHIPLSGASSAKTSDLLTFTEHGEEWFDPYEDMLSSYYNQVGSSKKKSKGDLIAHARVNTTPEMEAYVELDSSGDNVLSARGNGQLAIDVQTSKSLFEISGDYNISSGKYHFALPGIVSKDFTIDNGSSISFGGDIMESTLNIDATYSLRTGINQLIADTSSVSTRRLVNCGIHIADKLSSPSVSFSIDIPDLDPVTKAEVESALNTEDKVQKQFLALLITGGFITNEESGVVNNTNMFYSNMSEIMSRQLSNILGKLDIPLDLGVGYQQSSAGTNLFDVEVSTELFDNRVVVNGSLGNRQYGTSGNPNGDVVGDLDIDIKLDKRGELRLNLFSHSADEYTSYLDYSQRNGAGISYQKEFGTWKQFWRGLTRKRKKMPEGEQPRMDRRRLEELNETTILESNE